MVDGKARTWKLPLKALKAAEVTSLYEKHGSSLVAYVRCCGLDFASAEDVVQQVFLKLLRDSVLTPGSPAAYLYRAVRNASLNHRRNVQREVELVDSENWLVGPRGSSVEALAVQAALRNLPEEQRETVFLKVWGGMTLQEIADLLEVSINTVASRYRYALEKLREQLEPVAGR
jgi:RNA polymerase sigma-70 factor, ECF subfamily